MNLLQIPESTIRSIWKKYLSTGKVKTLKRKGRPRKLSKRDQNWIIRHTKTNRGRVLKDITNEFNESRGANDFVNPRTVQRFLRDHDYKRRVVRKKNGRFRDQQKKACCTVFREKKTHSE